MKTKVRIVMVLILLATAGVSYFVRANPGTEASAVPVEPLSLGDRTKEAHCQVNGAYPDPDCTPGAVFQVTKEQICQSGYAGNVRNVSTATKQKVYEEYGLSYPQAKDAYEADHFIPLELGGSNDIANLFPEAAAPPPGFHEKDLVENYLHQEVCAGHIQLPEAQREISVDWVKVYHSLNPLQILDLQQQFGH